MESVELGLKNSNRKENTVTGSAQISDDDFSIDDFFDFSDEGVFVEDEAESKLQRNREASVSQNDENILQRSNHFSSAGEDFPTSELSVPMDDLAELEWLSNFVEDTLTPYSAPTKKPAWLTRDRRHPIAPVNEDSCFKTPLPVKIRTKRARTGVSVWSLGSSLLTDSSPTSTTSSSSSSGPLSPLWLSGVEFLDEPVVQRQKMMKKKKNPSAIWTQTRRCSHCGVQKTPQWRAGPMGAKTLCNACGVRFKAGRLLPEYRPACSPTFSSELHSNHHRKVVEMRRKKEISDNADEPGLKQPVQTVQAVPSF
ncbi:hypothetical protein EUTSA_v10010566mg [Eutrema salsugineum]|uniref:GATA transcription factor n=1 Tax=Eutrema salsugineum TaxID=72664 RepID=V4LNR1_EUTSA|nr:GATA transcription factor 6 [Eutrema salsugineum]ESQ45409.1 hypothetical protein EUTSA_v10010566mg [Eutrema salsugineum]